MKVGLRWEVHWLYKPVHAYVNGGGTVPMIKIKL
jgi:hypothetical protein